MICNSKISDLRIKNKDKFNITSCHNELISETKEACPMNIYELWNFFNDYKIIFGFLLIIIGLFELILGAKIISITVFITTCAIISTLSFVILFQFVIPTSVTHNTVWVVLAFSLFIGILLGFIINKYKENIFSITIGGYTGYILGLLLYDFVLSSIDYNPEVFSNNIVDLLELYYYIYYTWCFCSFLLV